MLCVCTVQVTIIGPDPEQTRNWPDPEQTRNWRTKAQNVTPELRAAV